MAGERLNWRIDFFGEPSVMTGEKVRKLSSRGRVGLLLPVCCYMEASALPVRVRPLAVSMPSPTVELLASSPIGACRY